MQTTRLNQPHNRAALGAFHRSGSSNMQREFAVRQLAKRDGYRLEKQGAESYRLINARLNVAVYKLDGISLEAVASFLRQRESRANAPDAHHR